MRQLCKSLQDPMAVLGANRVKKANCALNTCKKAVRITWGLQPRITHWLYISVVRPIFLLLWWPSTQNMYMLYETAEQGPNMVGPSTLNMVGNH